MSISQMWQSPFLKPTKPCELTPKTNRLLVETRPDTTFHKILDCRRAKAPPSNIQHMQYMQRRQCMQYMQYKQYMQFMQNVQNMQYMQYKQYVQYMLDMQYKQYVQFIHSIHCQSS